MILPATQMIQLFSGVSQDSYLIVRIILGGENKIEPREAPAEAFTLVLAVSNLIDDLVEDSQVDFRPPKVFNKVNTLAAFATAYEFLSRNPTELGLEDWHDEQGESFADTQAELCSALLDIAASLRGLDYVWYPPWRRLWLEESNTGELRPPLTILPQAQTGVVPETGLYAVADENGLLMDCTIYSNGRPKKSISFSTSESVATVMTFIQQSGTAESETSRLQYYEELQERLTQFLSELQDKPSHLGCSFCQRTQLEVRKLIAGPGIYICDECVRLCMDIVEDEVESDSADANEKHS